VEKIVNGLSAAELKGRMERGERFAFVDARSFQEVTEFNTRLPDAIRMTVSEVDQYVRAVPQGRTIITYCAGRNEESSTKVALELMRRGFLNVYPLRGGLDAWCKVDGQIERGNKRKWERQQT
jgi:rhodanese-related sulfurtransferase